MEKEGLPDPVCRTGIISLPVVSLGRKQACCPHYCKECDDYKTCESVRGQASKNACCASNVLKLECGKGAPANICLKKCSKALPPCIMEDGQVWNLELPKVNAADDCNEAISEWRQHGKAAIEAGKEAVEEFEAKMTLKALEHVLETHKKLVDETAEKIEEVKAELSVDKAIYEKIHETTELLTEELSVAVKLKDLLAQAELHTLREGLTNETDKLTESMNTVMDALTAFEATKTSMEGYLKVLEGHQKKANEMPKHLLDKKQDIDVVHETAEKIRDLQFKVSNATIVLEEALKVAEDKAAKAKEIALEMKTTTTTTTTNLDCQCYHCGSDDEFNNADLCGVESNVCGPSSPNNGGCWTKRTEGCVCSTKKIIQACQCYHCGGSEEFNNANVCGAASDVCGPTSSANGGCWNNVAGAACKCSSWTTIG